MSVLLRSFFKPREEPERDLNALVESLRSDLGEHLESVLVFGSLASGDFDPKRSDINVLIVADLSFENLQQMGSVFRSWLRKGHGRPILVAPKELPGLARDFPIEFLDMLDYHRVLFGENPLTGLAVDRQHLRAECEQNLALVQLKLRQGIAAASGNSRRLPALLEKSLSSVLTLLRAIVRLEENASKLDKIKAAEHLAVRAGFDVSVLHRLQDLRSQRQTDDLNELTIRYLKLIEKVLQHLRK